MPYPYGTQGAPVVGGGLGGLPRRTAVAASASQRKSATVRNWLTTSASIPQTFIGSLIFDRENAKLRMYVSGSNDGGVNWQQWLCAWDVANDATLTNFTQTYINASSSPVTGGAGSGGALRHVAAETFNRSDGRLIVNNGYANSTRQRIDFSAHAVQTQNITGSGSYSNGGTWTSTQAWSDMGGCESIMNVPRRHMVTAFRDNNNLLGIQVHDMDSWTLFKATTSNVSVGTSTSQRATITKTSWGYVVVTCMSPSLGSSNVFIHTFDNNYDYIGGSLAAEPIVFRVFSTSNEQKLAGTFLAEDEGSIAVFVWEATRRSVGKLTIRLGASGVPDITGLRTGNMTSIAANLADTSLSDANQYMLPMSEYDYVTISKCKDYIANIFASRDLNEYQSTATNQLVAANTCLVTPRLLTSSINGLSPYSAQIEQVLDSQATRVNAVGQLVDYGDYAFQRYRITGDTATTIRIQSYRRNYTP